MSDASLHKNFFRSKPKPRSRSSFYQQALGYIKPVTLKPGTLHSLAVLFLSWHHLFSPPLPPSNRQAGEVFSAHLSLCHRGHIALLHLKPPDMRYWPGSSAWQCHGMFQCSPSAPPLQAGVGYPMGWAKCHSLGIGCHCSGTVKDAICGKCDHHDKWANHLKTYISSLIVRVGRQHFVQQNGGTLNFFFSVWDLLLIKDPLLPFCCLAIEFTRLLFT